MRLSVTPERAIDNVFELSAKIYTSAVSYQQVDAAIDQVAACIPEGKRAKFRIDLEEVAASVRMGMYRHRGAPINAWRQALVDQLGSAMAGENAA